MASQLIMILEKCFNQKNYKGAVSAVNEYDFSSFNEDGYVELTNFLNAYINEKTEHEDIHLFITSKTLLNTVSENFSAETVILQLIDEIPDASDDVAFLCLIEPLQKALLRVSKKHVSFLVWSLNSIQKYIESVPVPDSYDLTDEENLLMDADPEVDRATQLLMDFVPFYDPLVEDNTSNAEWRLVLGGFILKILGKPLAYFDLTALKSKSRARRVAELIVEKYLRLQRDIFVFLDHNIYSVSEDVPCDQLAVAVLHYLVLVEQVHFNQVPQVYDHLYVFHNGLSLVVQLLLKNVQSVIQKGLDLAERLLSNVRYIELSYELLDSTVHSDFCKYLSNVIVFNSNENTRKRALNLLRTYLFQFETRGRYLLIYNIIKVSKHTGLISYLITQYKEMLVEELNRAKGDTISAYFSGQKLFTLVRLFCHLHENEESDLIELADEIIAALNFLRFLVIRDTQNITKIWDILPDLEKSYFEPLRKGLSLSRAHYELKIKDMKEEQRNEKEKSKVEVVVAGEKLSDLPKSEKLKVLHSSLTTFDVIESLLCRVTELVHIQADRN